MAREIPDRREELGNDRVRLWFDVGGERLRCATTNRWQLDPATIERIGDALDAEHRDPPRIRYGDSDR